jgi:hypothetical protein
MGKSIRNLSTVTRVGLDLAKRVFQVHAVDAKGEIVVARKLTRSQLIPFFAELPPCVVAMEACSSAHQWRHTEVSQPFEIRTGLKTRSIVDAMLPCVAKGTDPPPADGRSWRDRRRDPRPLTVCRAGGRGRHGDLRRQGNASWQGKRQVGNAGGECSPTA